MGQVNNKIPGRSAGDFIVYGFSAGFFAANTSNADQPVIDASTTAAPTGAAGPGSSPTIKNTQTGLRSGSTAAITEQVAGLEERIARL